MNTVGAEHSSVHRGFSVGTGDRDVDPAAAHARHEAAQGHFDGCAVIGIGHKSVRQGMGTPVSGSGTADAQVRESHPAEVLNERQRSGAQYL